MSGEHQRRLWMLPISNTSFYDRMSIVVGRALSKSVSVNHDTLTKVLVSFNYVVDHDTLVKILTSIPTPSSGGGDGGEWPEPKKKVVVKPTKKKKGVIYLDSIDASKLSINRSINIRITALVDVGVVVEGVTLLSESDIMKMTILNVDFIEATDNRPVVVTVLKEDYDNS